MRRDEDAVNTTSDHSMRSARRRTASNGVPNDASSGVSNDGTRIWNGDDAESAGSSAQRSVRRSQQTTFGVVDGEQRCAGARTRPL